MKIAIEARSLTVQQTGIPKYVISLLTKISEFDDKNEYILLSDVNIKKEIMDKFSDKWKNIFWGKKVSHSYQMPLYIKFIEKICKQEKPDVFWSPTIITPNVSKVKMRLIMTIHDVIPIEHPEIYAFPRKMYFKHYLVKGLRRSTEIIFVSNTVKKEVNSLFSDILNSKKQFVVFNSINSDKDEEDMKEEDKNILKKINSRYLLFIGTKEIRKGILLIAEASKMLKGIEYSIVVAGKEGKGIRKFRKKVRNLNKIIEFPYVTKEEKNALLAHAEALLFPSLAEGFGIPLIEASRIKKPVIASDIPIFNEVLDGNYIHFRSGNARSLIDAIISFSKMSPSDISRIIERAYESSKKYDLKTESKKLYKILVGN